MSSTKRFIFCFTTVFYIKLVNLLKKYRILEKMYVWFYIISIDLKIMINIKKSCPAKQLYFLISYMDTKFCLIHWVKSRKFTIHSSHFHGAKMRQGWIFKQGHIIYYCVGQNEHLYKSWWFYPRCKCFAHNSPEYSIPIDIILSKWIVLFCL